MVCQFDGQNTKCPGAFRVMFIPQEKPGSVHQCQAASVCNTQKLIGCVKTVCIKAVLSE